ncbi:Protein FAM72A [Psilocybe cubensis]|uniref:Protein FAM72A n=2 Tax=Psilocybe cubensis TaxID=181762 RepID=A0ACB8HBE5_PSICU|nr:Protein FAM72A [Psilocybe cubensis]KAH9485055.1 Protein FAM72A [Psilocybe cubensis]
MADAEPPSFSYLPNQLHLFPQNPYPPYTVPAPIAHKVWILDCKSCSSFLTNRGMKAVLLLRPNVSLFSSDAQPTGCSPYSSSTEALRPLAAHKPSASPSRTCECLTQSLCCHTCGSTVGYMIVVPCTRCTYSIGATNRATNGHRFVFHSNEVVGTERHYVQGEPGVVPFDPPMFIPPPPPAMPTPHHASYPSPPFSPSPYYGHSSSHPRAVSPPVFRSDYLPTPPLEFATPAYAHSDSRHQSPDLDATPDYSRFYLPPASLRSPPPIIPVTTHYYPLSPRSPSDDFDSFSSASPPPLASPTFFPADHKEVPSQPPPSLKPGDVIFWHHLSRSGEIPGVHNDERARHPIAAKASREIFFNR